MTLGARRRCASLLVAGALVAGCSGEHGATRPGRPSVILVSIDTLRADHLGLYGYARDTSPFLDRLGAQSLVFENAYSPCPWTLVAHMTMLTGLYPPQHGVTAADRALAAEVPLLSETLRDAGYRTVGLYHPVWVNERHGFDRGFDVFRAHGEAAEAEEHLLEELPRLGASRPFFLFLHLFDVHQGPIRPDQHSIYPAPEPFQEMFAPGATERLPRVSWELDPKDPAQRADMAALYDGGIRHLDSELEQWFAELERRGLLEDTLVIVTADHGENLLDRGRVSGHGRFWNEAIRVPLIVRHPRGERAGERVRQNVHLGDIVPTVLASAGLPVDPRLPGTSLLAPLPDERVLFGEMEHHSYVLRGSRKIARGKAGFFSVDLAADPLEQRPQILGSCDEFEEWRARAFDPAQRFPPPRTIGQLSADEIEHLRALGYAGQVDGEGEGE
jgi:arylsulfatase A-like enzyme